MSRGQHNKAETPRSVHTVASSWLPDCRAVAPGERARVEGEAGVELSSASVQAAEAPGEPG